MEHSPRLELVVLLGFITLLGATSTLAGGLAALVITVVAGAFVFLTGQILRLGKAIPMAMKWAVLLSVGFGAGWIGSYIVFYVLPISSSLMLYLQLSGLTPLVYFAVGDSVSWRETGLNWLIFICLLPSIAALREFLGRGTLLGYIVGGNPAIPADFFAGPIGAFLVLGTLVIIARLAANLTGHKSKTGDPS